MAKERLPETILVLTQMTVLHDSQRYVKAGDVVTACRRPLEVALGHKLADMEWRLMYKAVGSIVQGLYSDDRYIPSHQNVPRIDGVPSYLTVALDGEAGFSHIRWDYSTSEDWDQQLGVLVRNKKIQDAALDKFQVVYDYVHPILEKSRKEMGRVIDTYSYNENEKRDAA